MARFGVRQGFVISGFILAALSGFFGLNIHYREVCVEPVLVIFCNRWEQQVVGYSLDAWAVGGIVLGIILILLGVALIIYPRLAKEMREETSELRDQK